MRSVIRCCNFFSWIKLAGVTWCGSSSMSNSCTSLNLAKHNSNYHHMLRQFLQYFSHTQSSLHTIDRLDNKINTLQRNIYWNRFCVVQQKHLATLYHSITPSAVPCQFKSSVEHEKYDWLNDSKQAAHNISRIDVTG